MGLCDGKGGWVDMVELFFFQAEDGVRDLTVTGVQTCALPILVEHAEGLVCLSGCARQGIRDEPTMRALLRSEERRVGKECWCGWAWRQYNKDKDRRNLESLRRGLGSAIASPARAGRLQRVPLM